MNSAKSKVVLAVSVALTLIALFYVVANGGIRGSLLKLAAPDFSTGRAYIDEFSLPPEEVPQALVSGNDGNVWGLHDRFRGVHQGPGIFRIKRGEVRSFSLARLGNLAGFRASGITFGPDGNLWFTLNGASTAKIASMTPNGSVKLIAKLEGEAGEILNGVDGRLWFHHAGVQGISPSGEIAPVDLSLAEGRYPREIESGRDGDVWVKYAGPSGAGALQLEASETVLDLPLPQGARNVTAAAGGGVWFAIYDKNENPSLALLNSQGYLTTFSLPSAPRGNMKIDSMTLGSDGNLWFRQYWETSVDGLFGKETRTVGMIGSATPKGKFTRFVVPQWKSFSESGAIISGPDGNIWYTDLDSVGRVRVLRAANNR